MKLHLFVMALIASASTWGGADAFAEGDPHRGAELFRQCLACHSVKPNEHLTGPSLSGVVGRKAGAVEDFGRYSQAIRQSDLVWTKANLDKWLQSPTDFLPGTSMRIPGIEDGRARRDIIAYLQGLMADGDVARESASGSPGGGMTGGGGKPRLINLKALSPRQQVTEIRYCGDAYHVTLATGDAYTFWEFNLRFKTDSSEFGPLKGKPVVIQGGMMGDRAFVIFAGPEEISSFIDRAC